MNPFFRPEPVAFYLFLALILAWIEVMAIRLRSVVKETSSQQPARVN